MNSIIELEEGEYIVTTLRKHWWQITVWAFGLLLMAFLPLVVVVLFFMVIPNVGVDSYANYIGLFYSVWITVLWVLFFIEWTDYYLDIWVITNNRIVDINHNGLFSREVSTLRLEDIEDITTELQGFLSVFLKFGLILIQTAGSRNEFCITNADNPEKVRQVIYNLLGDAKKRNSENV